jgi:hypothetical protein
VARSDDDHVVCSPHNLFGWDCCLMFHVSTCFFSSSSL